MVYGQLADERRREITLAHQLAERLTPLLKDPEKANPKILDEVLSRISQHIDKQPATPYRPAILQVQRRAEAARRGDAVPVSYTEDSGPALQILAIGKPAPDFVTTDLVNQTTARLRKLLGQPILMVFYNPNSKHAVDVLRYAQQVSVSQPDAITTIGLPVTDDAERILKQRTEHHITFPFLSGQGLKLTYAVEATPKFVVLDGSGIVRGAYVGWGAELPELIDAELGRCRRP
jgi:peroxiredoxin